MTSILTAFELVKKVYLTGEQLRDVLAPLFDDADKVGQAVKAIIAAHDAGAVKRRTDLDVGDTVMGSGRYATKSFYEIHQENPGYFAWAVKSHPSVFVKTKAAEFLALPDNKKVKVI